MNARNLSARLASVNPVSILLYGLIAWFVIAFLIYPNLNIYGEIFFKDGKFTLEAAEKLFSSERAMRSLYNSFILAFSLVITVNVVGITLVLISEYFDIKGAKFLRLGYFTTLIYSGVVLVSGYKFVYGEEGFMTKLLAQWFPSFNTTWFHGYWAVLFVMTFACTSNHFLFLSNAIRKIDFQTVEAARNMGASTWYILRRVVLPVLKPTIYALTILTFLTGLAATSAPLILGGKEFQTITPMILTFSKSMTSRDLAALLALILGVATLVLLTVMIRFERKGNFMSVSKVKSELVKQKIRSKSGNIAAHILAYSLFVLYIVPVVLIIIFSFTDAASISTATLNINSFTLDNYIQVFSSMSAFKPYLVSILYAAAASVIVVALALAASRILHKYKNKWALALEYALLIPWILPSTLIAIGLIVTFNTPKLMIGNTVLVGTIWMLLIAYVIIHIPFTLRMVKASFFSLDSNLEDAARNLGAKPFYTFRKVLLPIILPSTLAVLALNFNGILADYDVTVFLYHPLYQPLGIVIKNSTDAQALADTKALTLVYSVILMIMSSITLYFVYGRNSRS
ncbi:iron ABC transporter permease [Paenibacillus sp. FSL H8-0457]|uniref:ABC transporter permease n=1 Tax=unclassified Paenibacillus TaxID=185978 RepID=UPI0001788F65|nr:MULTISPECIES: iron ABC transporter permease [unclassified Paenibacillus]ACX67090.1 binding-protein-dependent transport systems inner membrane component [Paenibacillus sp. Y412MC10]ETT68576.1 binding-protein-dependent transport systems inner membrane component [Paenibacillus sp. FSL H8-457]